MSKLVRNNIPHIMRREGLHPKFHVVTKHSEQHKLLLDKLQEEVQEVIDSKDEYSMLQELGDVYEVIRAICEHMGCDVEYVHNLAGVKRFARGGFNQFVVLEDTDDIKTDYLYKI